MKRTFTLILAAAALLTAVLSCGCAGKNGGVPSKHLTSNVAYYYTGADTSSRFFIGDKLLEDKLGGEVDAFLTCDGTMGIARVGTGLYLVEESGVKMVYPAGVSRALLSLDGGTIVFTTATQVHIYDRGADELYDIKPDDAVSIPSIVLSPDGKTAGYTVKSSDGRFTSYAYAEGESRRLSNNAYIIGVADNAEFWYYLTPDAELHYAKSGHDKLLGRDAASLFEFNRSLTEVCFDMNGVTYCSRDGRSAKRLIEGRSALATAGECFSTQGGDDCISYVRDCDTLLDSVFYDYKSASDDSGSRTVYDLWYVDSGCKATALARGAYQFSIDAERKKLTCLIDMELYCMDVNDPGTAKLVASNVYSYVASTDLKNVYCIGYDRSLYCIRDLGSPVKLYDDVVYCVLTDGGSCLFISDFSDTGKLYCADGVSEPKKVGSKVYMVETKPGFCCYYSAPYTDGEGRTVYDLYTSPDGKSFELALEGVKLYTD